MDQYPTWVGFIFIFNLIVGTGSLILPSAFAKTGYVLSIILVLFLAFTSYLTVSFVVETLSISNAILKWRKIQLLKRREVSIQNAVYPINENGTSDNSDDDVGNESDDINQMESTPLTIQNNDFYTLNEKLEFGEMSKLLLSSTTSMIFYVCIVVYLTGDMSIYSAVVSTTIRDVICDKNPNITYDSNNTFYLPCFLDGTVTRFQAYRMCLMAFIVTMTPWVFFNVTKTKHLQFFTLLFRAIAFSVMIFIATYRIIFPANESEIPHPIKFDFTNVPFLVGSLIYAFMSQHSLPSLLVPIKEKDKISKIVTIDYVIITSLYLTLALTGIFAFKDVNVLYTLNFIPSNTDGSTLFKILEYFLALFPVLQTTTFPIVACTLRNNLQTLFIEKSQFNSQNFFVRRMLFPIMAVVPPFIITFNTENVKSLVSFTGCYAGAFIQYFIPVILVYYGRKSAANILGCGIVNEYRSKFQSNFWLIMLFAWTCLSLFIVTIDLFKATD